MTCSESKPVAGTKRRTLTKPVSITKRMPLIVTCGGTARANRSIVQSITIHYKESLPPSGSLRSVLASASMSYRGLGDVGGEDDLASAGGGGGEGLELLLRGKRRKQRAHLDAQVWTKKKTGRR